ncbi:dihydrofolate reductase [Coemansia aciculifera]|uniref:Dihydrofolate reductase n=1 Tax=Coemansia aciculifera TaxID=417176 RepID=A0ACC1M401_9FUNG|nr:dihydrofolate reductase [Coemansia aciculifera]KAJ2894347.1 dihydrofolate reductase [Coemansia aciculifera]
MTTKTITLIAAAATKNNGIGANKTIPWRLPKEMKYFNRVTTAGTTAGTPTSPAVMNACIMGRRNWESIPDAFRPLPKRYNIVVTSNPDLIPKNDAQYAVTAPSVAAALAHIDAVNSSNGPVKIDRVFSIGGYGIYKEAMDLEGYHVQILLTRVEFSDADCCDAFFPEIDMAKFKLQSHQRLSDVATFDVPSGTQTENGIDYQFLLYEN